MGANWFKGRGAERNFKKYVKPMFADKPCRYLEIGTWLGDSLVWMLENVLTHADSMAFVVDPWLKDNKNTQAEIDDVYREAWRRTTPWRDRVVFHRMPSEEWFRRESRKADKESFDFIYVDGCHVDVNVMDDAVNSWWLLKPGGMMIFDDYGSRERDPHHVRHAVDALMAMLGRDYAETLFINYQYGIQKVL
jgi:hypothetical protein